MYKKIVLFLGFLLIFKFLSVGQNPFPKHGDLFIEEVVPKIYITLPEDSLAAIFAQENLSSYHHYIADFIFDNGEERDTLEQVGFRLRGNTSRSSAKKSFKVSFNTYVPGRKYKGLEKLNLNGEHNDPSVIRSRICWDLLRDMGVPASRSNHIDLYVNGLYFGIYINVEHIDEEFAENRFGSQEGNLYKCLYPADLAYKGTNPDSYKFVSGGRRTYDLRTNTDKDDYSDLAHFINVLNNTDMWDIPCELDKVLNVDKVLRAMVFDVLSGNWDGPHYNKNNFYLYSNPQSGKFEYIPYDLDNTLGIDWLNKDWGNRNIYNWANSGENRPLFNKILSNPELRNRFSYYMDQFITEYFNEESLFPYIDDMRSMITPGIINDPFRPLDYDFSFQDFLNSYNQALDNYHVPYGLKPYITTRVNTALEQLQPGNIKPIIRNIEISRKNEALVIYADVEDDEGIEFVECCFRKDESEGFTCFEMNDLGNFPDEVAGDDNFSGVFTSQDFMGSIQYYVNAGDITAFEYRNPVCSELEYQFNLNDNKLFINEILADNENGIIDESDEKEDWIELIYTGEDSLFLGDKYLSDDRLDPNKWKMPNVYIKQGDYLVFFADNDEEQGNFHCGFKLKKEGEFIGVFDKIANEFTLLHGFDFGEQGPDISFGSYPDASGELVYLNPTPGMSNESLRSSDISTKELSVFPNPGRGIFHIKPYSGDLEVESIQVLDVSGSVQKCSYIEINNHIRLNINNLSKGVYFLNIHYHGLIYTEKILLF